MSHDTNPCDPALEARLRVVAARRNLLAIWNGQLPSEPSCVDSTVCLLDEAIAWLETA